MSCYALFIPVTVQRCSDDTSLAAVCLIASGPLIRLLTLNRTLSIFLSVDFQQQDMKLHGVKFFLFIYFILFIILIVVDVKVDIQSN